jgi:hypothetical protein
MLFLQKFFNTSRGTRKLKVIELQKMTSKSEKSILFLGLGIKLNEKAKLLKRIQ